MAKDKGAKLVKALPVSAPFHSALMAPAAERLAGELARVTISPMRGPVVANVSAEPNNDAARVKDLLVRQVTGGDQPLRGTMLVDSQTGEVLETTLTWERGPNGIIAVTFAHVADVDLLVPVRMSEQYRDARTTIFGEANYSRFRRFTTSARVITGPSDVR
jgi:[acyl-carrier-protein] S-malonyltransferase